MDLNLVEHKYINGLLFVLTPKLCPLPGYNPYPHPHSWDRLGFGFMFFFMCVCVNLICFSILFYFAPMIITNISMIVFISSPGAHLFCLPVTLIFYGSKVLVAIRLGIFFQGEFVC